MYDATAFKNGFDLDLPLWVWDGLPNQQIRIRTTNKGTAYIDEDDILEFNPRLLNGEEYTVYTKKSVLSHEMGHGYHYHTKIITNHQVHEQVKQSLNKCEEILKETPFWSTTINRESQYVIDLKKEFPHLSSEDADYMVSVIADIAQAASSGKYSYGHRKGYYQINPMYKYMELYAHALQVSVTKNEIMKTKFKDLYDILTELVKQ